MTKLVPVNQPMQATIAEGEVPVKNDEGTWIGFYGPHGERYERCTKQCTGTILWYRLIYDEPES